MRIVATILHDRLGGAMLEPRLSLVEEVLSHLCGKNVYGYVTEWCEMRHDCVYVVTCPECGQSFMLLEEEYDALIELSTQRAGSCGILPLD